MSNMRFLTKIVLLIAVATTLQGCFKDEKRGTLMRIAVYAQNVSSDELSKATDLEAYAFWVDSKKDWVVASWEDALDKRITNSENSSEVLTSPECIGVCDPLAEYQVTLDLTAATAFMVVVDRANKMYAYREYDTPINLPEVMTQLHIYAWRKSGTANGWNVINPFPDEERESLIPDQEPDEEQIGTGENE